MRKEPCTGYRDHEPETILWQEKSRPGEWAMGRDVLPRTEANTDAVTLENPEKNLAVHFLNLKKLGKKKMAHKIFI